jgi:hypothetical protein
MQKTSLTIVALMAVFVLASSAFSIGLKGDFDNDGDVDAEDLAVFSENYGKIDGTCTDSDNCVPGYYCEKDIGDCNGVGMCTEKPNGCPEIYDPVCGCDGETYANLCFAAAAGVNVLHKGQCPMPDLFMLDEIFTIEYQEEKQNEEENIRIKFERVRSDSRCQIDVLCVWQGNAEVEFSFSKNNVWRTILLNTGVEPTEVFLFGYSIKLESLEPPVLSNIPPEQEDYIAYLIIKKSTVSCLNNTDCSNDSYCAKEPGDCDGSGECRPRPTICPDVWDPVCGCDGKTYGNACDAAAAGINVDYKGECRPKYCYGNDMCGTDEYCLFEPCAVETGVCVPRPEICPYLWDPVCGCDNRTYPNACAAAANGMSVAYKSECEPDGCCVDLCGDGECNQTVCLACGCPCAETPTSCPQDCLAN